MTTALNVALTADTRSQLAARPTASLAAYDAFLKGQEAERRLGVLGIGRSVAQHYERAVGLDPNFALAWAQLSRVRSRQYSSGDADSAYARQSKEAADRAVTLAPSSPEGYVALAIYHNSVTNDTRRSRAGPGRGSAGGRPPDPRPRGFCARRSRAPDGGGARRPAVTRPARRGIGLSRAARRGDPRRGTRARSPPYQPRRRGRPLFAAPARPDPRAAGRSRAGA